MRARVLVAVLGAGAALLTAGCSGGHGTAGGSGQTVQVTTVAGKSDVLTDSTGHTLYVNDQESGGKTLCTTGDCTAIWVPVMVSGTPTGPSSVSGKLGTVTRDGKTQVSLDGKPLYTFSFDHAAGQATGDGKQDAFGGTSFTWHVALANGMSSSTPSSSSSYSGSGY